MQVPHNVEELIDYGSQPVSPYYTPILGIAEDGEAQTPTSPPPVRMPLSPNNHPRSRLMVVNGRESVSTASSGDRRASGQTIHPPRRTRTQRENPFEDPPATPMRTPSSQSFDLDDIISVNTMSTLPPSYHTRRSIPDYAMHPLPALPASDSSPCVPPSSYHRGRRLSPLSSLARAPPGPDQPDLSFEGDGDVSRSGRPSRVREDGTKRSFDGGVRLDVGPSGETSRRGASRDKKARNHAQSSTSPPPYLS
ncbi:hypothetical protein C8Q80DRAFT_447222 [Daedaleopsis nitida]|nr:hypothetical protein C8Q80DRAFT_447222 [Daedaleopsis nitida]